MDIRSREDALAYAAAHNVPVTATLKSIYSRDRNLWHLSHEGGLLEDPWQEPEEAMFQTQCLSRERPGPAAYVEIEFEHGHPVAVNGEKLSPANLVAHLNSIGGKHGVGRVDLVENRLVGMKSHGVYETPGGTILLAAHRELESIVLDTRHPALQRRGRASNMPNWFTTGSGSRPCAKPWMPSSNHPGTRDRQGPAQALQGQRHPRRAQEPLQPVPRGFRHLWPGKCLRPDPTPKALSTCTACP